MWLSRLTLDPRNRQVQRDLADVHALHRRVMGAFPKSADGGSARAQHGVLHRLDVAPSGALLLMVQSAVEPRDWHDVLPRGYTVESLPGRGIATRDASAVLDAVVDDAVFDFRLRANPTKRLAKSEPGSRLGKGTRVGLRTRPEQIAWLRRKAASHGFEIPEEPAGVPLVIDRERGPMYGRGRALAFEGVTFDGRLRVIDARSFRQALRTGIGSAKAFGFGLLTIARPGVTPR